MELNTILEMTKEWDEKRLRKDLQLILGYVIFNIETYIYFVSLNSSFFNDFYS